MKNIKMGYARVSTIEQNLDSQIDSLKEAGIHEDNIYTEKLSGKSITNREALKNVMMRLTKGDTLVVAKADRLSRSLTNLLSVMNELEDKGIKVQFLDINIDTASIHGKLIMGILGSVAEFERNLISIRIKEGLDARKKKGITHHRSIGKAIIASIKNAPANLNISQIARLCGVSRWTVAKYRKSHPQ